MLNDGDAMLFKREHNNSQHLQQPRRRRRPRPRPRPQPQPQQQQQPQQAQQQQQQNSDSFLRECTCCEAHDHVVKTGPNFLPWRNEMNDFERCWWNDNTQQVLLVCSYKNSDEQELARIRQGSCPFKRKTTQSVVLRVAWDEPHSDRIAFNRSAWWDGISRNSPTWPTESIELTQTWRVASTPSGLPLTLLREKGHCPLPC